jgi:hypothetical protein
MLNTIESGDRRRRLWTTGWESLSAVRLPTMAFILSRGIASGARDVYETSRASAASSAR